MDNKSTLLSTVLFSTIQQWDVKQFFLNKIKSPYTVDKLGAHLVQQTEKVQLSDFPDDDFIILGVSNKIGMFDAAKEKGRKIKQKYRIVKDNWIAYNPYRINIGSIGIKTPRLEGKYISPAYVVFSCKETLLPEFIFLLMKSDFFNSMIQDSTTGSVRQTLRFDKLANIKAPIPSIDDQQKILDSYHATLAEAEENTKRGNTYSKGLLTDIQSEVSSFKMPILNSTNATSIIQAVPFSAVDRWEVEYILKNDKVKDIYDSFKYPVYSISDLQTESLFGLSMKASKTQKPGMIPMLRMSNIVNGDIDCTEFKYLPYKVVGTDKEPDKWLLRKGDFLINRTNSKELVGKSAVFKLDGDYTYASYVIRYRFNTSLVLPDYVNILFMLPIVRIQIDTMSRQTAGQCNINSDEIGSIRIPVPSIPIQQAIIDKYNSAKDGSRAYYEKADELRRKAAVDFEHKIFYM